jgi:hypothetical protein
LAIGGCGVEAGTEITLLAVEAEFSFFFDLQRVGLSSPKLFLVYIYQFLFLITLMLTQNTQQLSRIPMPTTLR